MSLSTAAQIATLEAKLAETIVARDIDQAKDLQTEVEPLKETPPPETLKVSRSKAAQIEGHLPTRVAQAMGTTAEGSRGFFWKQVEPNLKKLTDNLEDIG